MFWSLVWISCKYWLGWSSGLSKAHVFAYLVVFEKSFTRFKSALWNLFNRKDIFFSFWTEEKKLSEKNMHSIKNTRGHFWHKK
jgi:hypothetical protein